MEASVLPKVTADLPTIPVSPVTQWKHLSGLEFADPDYGTPARVDILLGGDVFSKAVLHGRRYGPTGAPSAFKTCFGWVLNGETNSPRRQGTSHVCCVALDGNALRRRAHRAHGRTNPHMSSPCHVETYLTEKDEPVPKPEEEVKQKRKESQDLFRRVGFLS